VGTSFFRFVTKHAFDRQPDRQTDGRTDGQTDGQKGLHNTVRCITCSGTVKMDFCKADMLSMDTASTQLNDPLDTMRTTYAKITETVTTNCKCW